MWGKGASTADEAVAEGASTADEAAAVAPLDRERGLTATCLLLPPSPSFSQTLWLDKKGNEMFSAEEVHRLYADFDDNWWWHIKQIRKKRIDQRGLGDIPLKEASDYVLANKFSLTNNERGLFDRFIEMSFDEDWGVLPALFPLKVKRLHEQVLILDKVQVRLECQTQMCALLYH